MVFVPSTAKVFAALMPSKREVGLSGEEKATFFLKKNGYRILGRNVRNYYGEIDIVAQEGGVICFVEVRSRVQPCRREEALVSIGPRKQRKLSQAASCYLREKSCWDQRARFDVVVLSGEDGFLLLKDAFPVAAPYG